jgi:hypothetical protein
MEFYLDPDGYWITYEEHSQDLDVFEAVLDKALEDVFDQKYMITDLKEKLSISNKALIKLLIVTIALLAFAISKYTGLIQ